VILSTNPKKLIFILYIFFINVKNICKVLYFSIKLFKKAQKKIKIYSNMEYWVKNTLNKISTAGIISQRLVAIRFLYAWGDKPTVPLKIFEKFE